MQKKERILSQYFTHFIFIFECSIPYGSNGIEGSKCQKRRVLVFDVCKKIVQISPIFWPSMYWLWCVESSLAVC